MKVNITLTPEANLLAAINAANVGANITAAQVTFGAVSVSAGTGGRNSSVTLTGVNGQGIEGSRAFAYTRQALSAGALPSVVPFISIAPGDTRPQVLAKACTQLGLIATEIEDISYTAPVDVDTHGAMQIAALVGSLLYYDLKDLEIRLIDTDVAFATVAPVTDLDAFEAEA